MPRDIRLDVVNYILLLVNLINFFSLHFVFWQCMISVSIQRAIFVVIRHKIYMEPIAASTIFDTVLNLCWMAITLSITHFVITSAGLLFIEADILRQGNEGLLNSLD